MNKFVKLLTHEVAIVALLGAISVTTAWAGVQSSLHGGVASDALSIYQEDLSEADNIWITSELKYRTDMPVWADKQTKLNQGADMYAGYSAGSYELYEFAMPCLEKAPESQLADCKPYMDELYVPYQEVFEQSGVALQEYETEGKYSDRLQMLTALLAVSLFMLGVASVIKSKKLVAAIVIGATFIWLFSFAVLISIPVVF